MNINPENNNDIPEDKDEIDAENAAIDAAVAAKKRQQEEEAEMLRRNATRGLVT